MKTKEEIIKANTQSEPFDGFRHTHTISIPKCMDEYAEEYAKAFLIWYSKLEVVNMSEITRNSLLAAFKESLKK